MLAEITFTFSNLFGILQAFAKHTVYDSEQISNWQPLVGGRQVQTSCKEGAHTNPRNTPQF